MPLTWVLANWKLAVMAVLLALLGLQTVRVAGLKQDAADQRATAAEVARIAERANRTKEQSWQDAANQSAKAKDEALLNIHARLDDALGELRNRPQRPTGAMPAASGDGKAGTGAGIYAEDAGFLVREAARADELRAALGACYSQYDALTR